MSEWEEVTENTWRLELEDGYLYRFGSSLVHVPSNAIAESLYNLSDTLEELCLLFEQATFEVDGRDGVRAIRNSNIGD